MKTEDPDLKGGDPDMSLNRKTQGSVALAAARIVLAKTADDLDAVVDSFTDDLHSVSPALAKDFSKYAESQHVEWVKEGWADEDAIKKEISDITKMSSSFKKLGRSLSSVLRRADAEDIPEIVSQHWPSGPRGWAERGAVLDGLLSAIDSVRLPQAYKVPFLRGNPTDALQDRKLLRKLIESSGSAAQSTEEDILRFSQLAAAYQLLSANPESVSVESMRSGMDDLAKELDESSKELFELGEILDAWVSTSKEFKPSKSRSPTFESTRDYNRVLSSLDDFFNSSEIVDPGPVIDELEEYAKENFESLPPELEGMFEGFKRAAASNKPCGEAMSKRVATYHGVVDQRGNPVQTTNTGYKSFHSRHFTEENYKAILAYADALLEEPWLKYGWDGGSKDAQIRAALDLAIHMADESLYQSKIDVDTYNLLYARFAKTGQDTFSETVIPEQGKVGKKRSAKEMRNRQAYQNIVRVASELRTKDPAAALDIIKNLRSLVSSDVDPADSIQSHVALEETDAEPAQAPQDLVGGCEAGADEEETAQTMVEQERVSQDPGDTLEFRSMGDSDFKKLKQDLKREVDQLFSEDDVDAFLSGFENIIADVEKKTASALGDGVPLSVLIKLAAASPEAKFLLGPVIVAAKKKKDKKKAPKKGKKAPKKDKGPESKSAPPFGGKKAPPFGGKKAPPFGGKKKKASLTVEDANW